MTYPYELCVNGHLGIFWAKSLTGAYQLARKIFGFDALIVDTANAYRVDKP